jgi:pimeloyl-ACP methyl ester carboxylesterase
MSNPTAAEAGHAEVNGARLYYEIAGEGHALVLLHGGLVDSGLWDPQFPVFARRYRTIRYDLRGFGRSSPAEGSYSHFDDLSALMARLGVERAHVLGLSMSGTVALDFALAHPSLTTALVHVAGGLSGYQPESVTEQERELFEGEEAAYERGDMAEAVALTLRLWTVGPTRTPDAVAPEILARVREMSERLYARGEATPTRKLEPPAAERLREVRAPTLLVHGDRDVSHIAEVAERIEAGIPGARRVVIPDTAHHLNLERPEEFNRVVLAFLDSV